MLTENHIQKILPLMPSCMGVMRKTVQHNAPIDTTIPRNVASGSAWV